MVDLGYLACSWGYSAHPSRCHLILHPFHTVSTFPNEGLAADHPWSEKICCSAPSWAGSYQLLSALLWVQHCSTLPRHKVVEGCACPRVQEDAIVVVHHLCDSQHPWWCCSHGLQQVDNFTPHSFTLWRCTCRCRSWWLSALLSTHRWSSSARRCWSVQMLNLWLSTFSSFVKLVFSFGLAFVILVLSFFLFLLDCPLSFSLQDSWPCPVLGNPLPCAPNSSTWNISCPCRRGRSSHARTCTFAQICIQSLNPVSAQLHSTAWTSLLSILQSFLDPCSPSPHSPLPSTSGWLVWSCWGLHRGAMVQVVRFSHK